MKEELEKCEGCGATATTYDSEAVPLCKECSELPDSGEDGVINNRGLEQCVAAPRSSMQRLARWWRVNVTGTIKRTVSCDISRDGRFWVMAEHDTKTGQTTVLKHWHTT